MSFERTVRRSSRTIEVTGLFKAILACLLAEVSTTPNIEELRVTPDLDSARLEGNAGFEHFLSAEADLIRYIQDVARRAEFDGDEVGNLAGRVAEIKRIR